NLKASFRSGKYCIAIGIGRIVSNPRTVTPVERRGDYDVRAGLDMPHSSLSVPRQPAEYSAHAFPPKTKDDPEFRASGGDGSLERGFPQAAWSGGASGSSLASRSRRAQYPHAGTIGGEWRDRRSFTRDLSRTIAFARQYHHKLYQRAVVSRLESVRSIAR